MTRKSTFENTIDEVAFISIFFVSIFAVFIVAIYKGLVNLGIGIKSNSTIHYNVNQIKSSAILMYSSYMIFGFISLLCVYEVFSLFPDVSNFSSFGLKCTLLTYNSRNCYLNHFGIFQSKLHLNFNILRLIYIITEVFFLILTFFFLVYLPVKAALKIVNAKNSENRSEEMEIDETETERICA